MKNIKFVLFGTVFGIILTKSEVISWFRIHDMFLFNEPHMYLIITSAIVTAAISVLILKAFKIKSLDKKEIVIEKKAMNKGVIIGGTIFGIGWAITGACPGPIFAQVGAGEWAAIFTLIGAVLGAYTYAVSKSKLPH